MNYFDKEMQENYFDKEMQEFEGYLKFLGRELAADFMEEIKIKQVIFSKPATIVRWSDGTKTIVKCQKGESFDREKGLALAICKKCLGNTGAYYDVFKKFIDYDEYHAEDCEKECDHSCCCSQ